MRSPPERSSPCGCAKKNPFVRHTSAAMFPLLPGLVTDLLTMSGLKKAYKNDRPSRRQARHWDGGLKGQAREAFPRSNPGSPRGNALKRGGPGPPRPLIFPHGPQVPEGDRGRHGIPWAARARPGDGHRPRARLAEASRHMANVPGAMPRGAGTAPGAPCLGALRIGNTSEGGDNTTRPLAGTGARPLSITGPLAHQRKAEASNRSREAGAVRARGPPVGARLPSGLQSVGDGPHAPVIARAC